MVVSKYMPKLPPVEARHREMSNGKCKVLLIPIKWRRYKGVVTVTEACAICKTCGWDTPTMFSMNRVESATRRHLGLLQSHETNQEGTQ